MSSADGEAAGPGSGGCEDFAELLLGEVTGPEGMDGGSVQMLIEMAKSGDIDTVADTLSYLVEAGAPDKAAGNAAWRVVFRWCVSAPLQFWHGLPLAGDRTHA